MKRATTLFLCLLMMLSLFGCASQGGTTETPTQAPESAEYTYADTIAWDGEYDVVVVGFGNAGAVSAITAADNGAKVLVLEKAPKGEAGGNSRVCGQLYAYGHEDVDATLAYYKGLAAENEIPEAMLQVYAEGIAYMTSKLVNTYGADPSTIKEWLSDSPIGYMSPEYPELPGSDKITLNSLDGARGNSFLYNFFQTHVSERSDNIDVWYESPGIHLIQDPQSKTILGVQAERGGETLNIRATNGVVLATGGFENNQEMVECYLGLAKSTYAGSSYNTGDGVRMAMEVGADLWHMDVFEGAGILSYAVPEGERFQLSKITAGSIIAVGGDGSRYMIETGVGRHGHVYHAGVWLNPQFPATTYVVMDQKQYDTISENLADIVRDIVIQSDTIEGLADAAGMDPEILSATVTKFNSYAETGVDLDFGRSAASMTAFSAEGPYYAIESIPSILNTQGGPRRNENAEILDVNGDPIPHLYSAGELGGICSYQYQGGGNMDECIIFGEIAGKNAAVPKEALPAYEATPVESNLVYVPGYFSDLNAATDYETEYPVGENEYLGVSSAGMGGDLVVKITMDGGKIAKMEVLSNSETEGFGSKAIESMPTEFVGCQTAEDVAAVDGVSGATLTSKALREAVTDALSKVQ